ncbi:uncharacterized protein LOC115985397 [Quercus lobata]|uniref:uncharacterized protein LOC115985397 n=1 Tax=Quercus lobata TaxID=97700 RepID=UPI0012450302|nr:uncharacterized protein LOC115985397 [Quercus lobata]
MDGSDDEQLPEQVEFNVKSDMRNVVLKKEMKFPNAKVFRAALREYAIKKPIDIKFKLNERTKISVHCRNRCGWRCYASQISEELTFQIKTLTDDCTCPKSFKNSQATSVYIAKRFIENFSKNPNWEVSGIHNHVMQNLSVNLNVNQVYRSKRKAKDLINEDEQLQYGVLRDYAQMITTIDKGSRVILQTEMAKETSQPKFKRMYVRFNAQKVGFLGGCRPFIGLDGCHIKHRFGGKILSAIAKDANDNIFPVAMAVVEQETRESWIWFLEIFANDIGRPEELQLGLIPAIETLFPTVEHRYCVKHIYNNLKVDHKGLELKDALWRCAATTTVREFERCMQYIRDLDEKAYEYLANIAPAQWTRSHFTPRALTNCLKYAGKLCPSIQDRLEKLKVESKAFSATLAGSFLYEVDSQYERHVIDLVKKTCSYKSWDLNGIPCKHAITAIYTNIETPEDYTHPYYFKETDMEIYKEAREGVLAPRSAPQPPSQQPTQTYNMMSATQPSSSQQGNQPRPSHKRAGWFSSSQPEFHTPRETWDTLPSSSQPSHANGSTGGVRTRGQLAAQRPPKMNPMGGKRKE